MAVTCGGERITDTLFSWSEQSITDSCVPQVDAPILMPSRNDTRIGTSRSSANRSGRSP